MPLPVIRTSDGYYSPHEANLAVRPISRPVADKLLIASVILMLCAFGRIEVVCRRRHSIQKFWCQGCGSFWLASARFTRQQAREMENNNTNVRSGLSYCRHLGAGLDTLRVDR